MLIKSANEPFDSNMNIIRNYLSTQFNETHNDGGYAIRTIEIKRFNIIKSLCEKFECLTGYKVPYTECDASEMNLLVKRGLSVINVADKAYKEAIADAKKIENEITQAQKGGSREFGGYESLLAYLQNLEYRKERVEGYIAPAHQLLTERRKLLGMLRQQAEVLSATNTSDLIPVILTQIPTEYLTGCPIKESYFNKSDSPILFAWKKLDALETALRRVISLCTVPTDKYELNNGGENKTHYYREYFSSDNVELRQNMTAIDYVNTKYLHKQSVDKNTQMMNSSL